MFFDVIILHHCDDCDGCDLRIYHLRQNFFDQGMKDKG
jgi:hypothetical protein